MAEGGGHEGLAHSNSDSERLQLLRDRLPCSVVVSAPRHPLFGEELAARTFKRLRGELLLVVVLPDGSPGTILVEATDVLSEPVSLRWVEATLSVDGVRHLRALLGRVAVPDTAGAKRPKPWKVVRHHPGVDPLERREWVYSAHTTDVAARRARDRVRAAFVRAEGYEAAAVWTWAVVHDPVGVIMNPPAAQK